MIRLNKISLPSLFAHARAKARAIAPAAVALLAAASLSSCAMMQDEDRDDCPTGLYVAFTYDYNLQHADLRPYHVGSVTLYVFDEEGRFVKKQTETNTESYKPLAEHDYLMHVTGLEPGRYQFLALAGQDGYEAQLARDRAIFRRIEPAEGDSMNTLQVHLDRVADGVVADYRIENNGQPLDTLWHGIKTRLLEVRADEPAYDTIPLVRDTKKINVTLRELSDPTAIELGDYDFAIYDRNSHLTWDNTPDNRSLVVYTPHYQWLSYDRTDDETDTKATVTGAGHILHADFMTSRIIYQDSASDDGLLVITEAETGKEVVKVDLPDMLSRLQRYETIHKYTRQEFLDRCYDYQLDFYLVGGQLSYVEISVSVLSWNVRVQFEELGTKL